jgi:hypothetical protein
MDNQQMLPQDVEEKGQAIYEQLKEKLESEHMGKFLTIEVVTGDYFIGDTLEEALTKATEKYPGKLFHTVKIGAPGIYSISSAVSNDGYYNWFPRC